MDSPRSSSAREVSGTSSEAGGPGTREAGAQPIGELVGQATQQMSELVRGEMRLAVAELKDKGRHAGKGAGLFGGAGLVALYGAGALIAACIAGLAVVMPTWAAALIVAAVLLAAAGLLAMLGRRETGQATPMVPEKAAEDIKQDIATIKERAHR
ncbi:phage holin family protein [Actinomadura nitritigenes]|uniref:phage holin family protein n=1 Tax=Actinomadura nitritigenes TaxID=134602 RepID=UPI003D8E3669